MWGEWNLGYILPHTKHLPKKPQRCKEATEAPSRASLRELGEVSSAAGERCLTSSPAIMG